MYALPHAGGVVKQQQDSDGPPRVDLRSDTVTLPTPAVRWPTHLGGISTRRWCRGRWGRTPVALTVPSREHSLHPPSGVTATDAGSHGLCCVRR
jgi:hypothetical protein